MRKNHFIGLLVWVLFLNGVPAIGFAQSTGTLRGKVTLETTGNPIHNVIITISRLNRSTETDDNGVYELQNIPPGTYEIIAHLDRVPDVVETVTVTAGGTTTADIQIRLTTRREEVTVTATGAEETSFNSIQSVTSLSSVQISEKNSQSIGEALDHELGVAKRSFGPGNARPVIRGFDSDRVLVVQDGNRIGSLGFQSGDHGEPIDVLSLDKLEVVKGPATLLYGSSAIGGVVNAVTGHDTPHEGMHGYVTALGSTNNWQGGGSAGFEYGTKRWLVWGTGSGQRSGDYDTPIGRITNSYARNGAGEGGFGYYPGRGFVSFNYVYDKMVYGIPINPAEEEPEIIHLNPRRHSIRFNGGMRDIQSFINSAQFSLQYNDYEHGEIDSVTDVVNTLFKNKTFTYRGYFDQKRENRLSGTFGFWGLHRDYESIGEEALSPPTKQNAFAVFALEKIDFERIGFQFGGRFEHNGYNRTRYSIVRRPTAHSMVFPARPACAVPLWRAAHSSPTTRTPTARPRSKSFTTWGRTPETSFEIGDPNLKRESSDGLDLSLRHGNDRVRAEFNFFYYRFRDFIFLAPTGEIEDGLIVAEYVQADARYTGVEFGLTRASPKHLAVVGDSITLTRS